MELARQLYTIVWSWLHVFG